MNRGIFIQANRKQYLGALIAKHAMETRGKAKEHGILVSIMLVEEMPAYMKYAGMRYQRRGEMRTHDPADLQFFTLSRFAPPELMHYEGRAIVIDPDIFALADVAPLFDLDLKGNALAACPSKGGFDSSVMVLDCAKLRHWSIEKILGALKDGTADYDDWMRLRKESVLPLSRDWNSLDHLTDETKLLHTTNRLTQPWKTGLPIDFTRNKMPKIFGIIPREPIQKMFGSYATHYQPHPNTEIERLFFTLAREAIQDGAVSRNALQAEIAARHVRPDLLERVS
ncbi:MAG TPA: hypothetical protein VMT80_00060 [Candidatus Paceibacterota bacterium]|nr:hypothetical protein [Candidatus Paceibacterota bacterium]